MVEKGSNMRAVTIDSHILKVIEDAYEVRRDRSNLKFIKHEMLPPLTASFRQNRAIRGVHKLHGVLRKEIEKCDQNDLVRQQVLDEVLTKCENLKAAFESSEGAISQLQRQKETHKQVMDNITNEIKASTMEIKRYFKAAEDLTAIREIMQSVIKENTCYLDFLEKVAAESKRYRSAREITGRYEKLLSVKKLLTEQLDDALERMEETKKQIIQDNAAGNAEQHFVLQRLQAIDYELNLVKTRTVKYEMALNNISIESLGQMRTLNLVLKSAEQMIENLIKEKVISKKYRKKTLAQQFEVIRKDYLKKKAVLREYQRGMEQVKAKKTKRVKIFDDYENNLVQKQRSSKRLEDLLRKKKVLYWKKQEAEHARKMKRLRGRMDEDSEEDVDVSAELDRRVVIMTEGKGSKEEEDDDMDDEDLDEDLDDLGKFGSHESSAASLVGDLMQPEFVSVAPESSDVSSSLGGSTLGSITRASDTSSYLTLPRRVTQDGKLKLLS